jgi:polyisoprenoid-binding protein YceI
MKKLLITLILSLPLLASNLTLKDGFVAAHTEMLMDSTIDPLNTGLKAEITMDNTIESLRGNFSVDMNFFSSDNEDRDIDMHKSTEAEKFPLAKYSIKKVTKVEGENSYILEGVLNFHNTDRELSFNVEIVQDASSVIIKGTSKILVSDYGIEMPCMVFMCVRDEVDLFVKATLIK